MGEGRLGRVSGCRGVGVSGCQASGYLKYYSQHRGVSLIKHSNIHMSAGGVCLYMSHVTMWSDLRAVANSQVEICMYPDDLIASTVTCEMGSGGLEISSVHTCDMEHVTSISRSGHTI